MEVNAVNNSVDEGDEIVFYYWDQEHLLFIDQVQGCQDVNHLHVMICLHDRIQSKGCLSRIPPAFFQYDDDNKLISEKYQ